MQLQIDALSLWRHAHDQESVWFEPRKDSTHHSTTNKSIFSKTSMHKTRTSDNEGTKHISETSRGISHVSQRQLDRHSGATSLKFHYKSLPSPPYIACTYPLLFWYIRYPPPHTPEPYKPATHCHEPRGWYFEGSSMNFPQSASSEPSNSRWSVSGVIHIWAAMSGHYSSSKDNTFEASIRWETSCFNKKNDIIFLDPDYSENAKLQHNPSPFELQIPVPYNLATW